MSSKKTSNSNSKPANTNNASSSTASSSTTTPATVDSVASSLSSTSITNNNDSSATSSVASAIASAALSSTGKKTEVLEKLMGYEKDKGVDSKGHKFWDTQPVPKLDSRSSKHHGPIDEIKKVSDVRPTPYGLPAGYMWCEVDIDNAEELNEVYNLLHNHYVEDADATFRFDYSKDFLKWALHPPGYKKDWIVGVRTSAAPHTLYGFITGIPVHVHVYDHDMMMAEINFLCVHRSLRSKRLAPVLIKEVTRRVNLCDIWQAVYTAGIELPKPVSESRYWHRSLNVKKLVEIKFTGIPHRMTLVRLMKIMQLPPKPTLPIRPLVKEDVPQVRTLLNNYLASKTKLRPEWSEEETLHWLLPHPGVISSYVIESSDKSGKIIAFCSFYEIPSSVLNNEHHDRLRAAYSFYNIATQGVSLVDLMNNALILAQIEGFDVFNCLGLMENESFIKDLRFGEGSGNLRYYLYNWACPTVKPSDLGMVLL